jgi:Ser/Thr protein kinase RdoA (MazF antagonist)
VHGDPQLDTLDGATLTPLVRRALNHETATLLEWQWSPIVYDVYLPGRTLGRFIGAAIVDGGVIPWSIVLKRTRPPQGREQASDDGCKREVLAYRSGLLADIPGQLRAARALDVSEDVHGTTWLWLEDVVDSFGREWPLAQYRRAARHLGQFNGAYLAGRPLPAFPWLMPSWAEHHSEPWKIPEALPEIEALASAARARQAFPVPIADLAPQLLRDVPTFVGILARLPQTLCHHDAARANLFARQCADGTIETVAIDWEAIGPGTVGAEIATLVFGTMRRGDFSAEHATDLDRDVFAGYLAGLRDAEGQGDPDLVRLGYTAAVALRWFLLRGTLRALTGDGPPAMRGRASTESAERAVEQFILLSLFLLERADEARRLARRFALIP